MCVCVFSNENELNIHCTKIKNIRTYTSIASHIFMVLQLTFWHRSFTFKFNTLCM